jgi:hypothetical protein
MAPPPILTITREQLEQQSNLKQSKMTSFPKQLELDALKQRIKETAANLAEMRKQLPAATAAAKEEGGKPKKTLSPEHLAAMKAGREKKKAEKASSPSPSPSADEAEVPAPKKVKKAKKVKAEVEITGAEVEPVLAEAVPEAKKKAKKAKGTSSESEGDADAEPKEKEKRAVAPGTLAWHAYVKHMVETRPEAFVDMKQPQKFTVAKGMRAADPSGYASFVADWKAL